MVYAIQTEHFFGPLDVLLALIEHEKLDITKVSLANVTDQYLAYVRKLGTKDPEEISDFLLIAARLLLLKSVVLLPMFTTHEEEQLVDEFEQQMRVYQLFARVAKLVNREWSKNVVLYARDRVPEGLVSGFHAPPRCTSHILEEAMQAFLKRRTPSVTEPTEMMRRCISIEDRLQHFEHRLQQRISFLFSSVAEGHVSREIVIISFLALLELLKQRRVSVEQDDLFSDMVIQPLGN